MIHFKDRRDAGNQLAQKLSRYAHAANTIVLGLPRGGIITADEIAHSLSLPLDCIITRKLGTPGQPELAIGALLQDGTPLFNEKLMEELGLTNADLTEVIAHERDELKRRLDLYRANKPPLNLKNKTALLVDDGIATGMTMFAAIASAKKLGAAKIIVVTPIVPADLLPTLQEEADSIVYLETPVIFLGISAFYTYFPQITDQEVISCLRQV